MINEIKFKKAKNQDLDYLVSLRKMTMKEHLERAGIGYDEKIQLMRVKYHYQDAEIIYYRQKRIGLIKVDRIGIPWHLIQIQLETLYQNKGLGTQIISTLLNEAKKVHVRVQLTVLKSNPAYHLYQRLGFAVIEHKAHSYEMLY